MPVQGGGGRKTFISIDPTHPHYWEATCGHNSLSCWESLLPIYYMIILWFVIDFITELENNFVVVILVKLCRQL